MNQGVYSATPQVLGLPPARVTFIGITESNVASFDVEFEDHNGWPIRLRRALMWPFTARAAARELKEANETLATRYRELDQSRIKLAAQAEQLEAVDALAKDLTTTTDMPELGKVLSSVLQDKFGVRSGKIVVYDESSLDEHVICEFGSTSPQQRIEMQVGGRRIGRLHIDGDQQQPRHVSLLQLSVPWISVALENARSFAMLRNYQDNLEQMVKERTAQLELTLEQMKAANERRLHFFSHASHELRTPLTLVLAPLETFAASPNVSPEVRESLDVAVRNAYRLYKIVNDVLDLSKLESGAFKLQAGVADLTSLLGELLTPFQPLATRRKVTLGTALPTSLPVVCDPERIEQIAMNLVSNALKFTPDGGRVTIGASESKDGFEFYVENSGEGIDPDDVPKLFERFAQSSRSAQRRYGSSGLGLAIVHEFTQLHGGKVSLDNRPGESVRFTVSIPRLSADRHAEVKPLTRAERLQYEAVADRDPGLAPTPSITETRLPVLLLVEDNTEMRQLLANGVSDVFHVIEARDGIQGLELAKKYLPDIILADVMMPLMDGTELCGKLKEEERTAIIPFLMLTARSELENKLFHLGQGADDYIGKPFHLAEVKARLMSHLRMRAMQHELAQREKLAALGTVVAGVAHEIRNPLNGIINALNPIRKGLITDPKDVTELIDIAIDSAKRVDVLSSKLLKQVRSGEGERSVIDVSANVAGAMQMLEHKVKDGPHLVQKLAERHTCHVVGEPGALNQVWVNLVDNAIQAVGPTGTVTIEVVGTPRHTIVEVRDTGPGIPADLVHRVFDPFFTTKPVGTGTGLGLSTVRDIVKSHGGSISVESPPGAGAVFRVTLPTAPPGDVRAPSPH
ncbi:MAG: response regulator [Archangium sp.]|nr:response regulator [Archangium sp.]